MQKVKKIPQRQCLGCREMKDKKSLLRVVQYILVGTTAILQ